MSARSKQKDERAAVPASTGPDHRVPIRSAIPRPETADALTASQGLHNAAASGAKLPARAREKLNRQWSRYVVRARRWGHDNETRPSGGRTPPLPFSGGAAAGGSACSAAAQPHSPTATAPWLPTPFYAAGAARCNGCVPRDSASLFSAHMHSAGGRKERLELPSPRLMAPSVHTVVLGCANRRR